MNKFGEDKAIMVNNADWLLNLNYIELLREVGACFSVNNMLRAECYKQRMEKGLSFLEFNYMIMQAYDFYHLHQNYGCNMQFGGDDQWSNMLAGTELIRKKTGEDAYAMTITLLMNSEGKKMGKTAKGAVWLDPNKTSPFEFYQYWRNVNDADVMKCLKMLTFLPIEQIEEMEKWEASRINDKKEILAFELTALVHGAEEANKANDNEELISEDSFDNYFFAYGIRFEIDTNNLQNYKFEIYPKSDVNYDEVAATDSYKTDEEIKNMTKFFNGEDKAGKNLRAYYGRAVYEILNLINSEIKNNKLNEKKLPEELKEML